MPPNPPPPYPYGPYYLGVDVAREGDSETALALLAEAPWQPQGGARLIHLEAHRSLDTMATTARVKTFWDAAQTGALDQLLAASPYPPLTGRPRLPSQDSLVGKPRAKPSDYKPDPLTIAIDDGSAGGGVVDRLRELNVFRHAVKFGAPPEGRMAVHFYNKSAEMYWGLREALRLGHLSLTRDDKLFAQLLQIQWELYSDKQIRVHKTGFDDKRPSPDRADALALAWESRRQATKGLGIVI